MSKVETILYGPVKTCNFKTKHIRFNRKSRKLDDELDLFFSNLSSIVL